MSKQKRLITYTLNEIPFRLNAYARAYVEGDGAKKGFCLHGNSIILKRFHSYSKFFPQTIDGTKWKLKLYIRNIEGNNEAKQDNELSDVVKIIDEELLFRSCIINALQFQYDGVLDYETEDGKAMKGIILKLVEENVSESVRDNKSMFVEHTLVKSENYRNENINSIEQEFKEKMDKMIELYNLDHDLWEEDEKIDYIYMGKSKREIKDKATKGFINQFSYKGMWMVDYAIENIYKLYRSYEQLEDVLEKWYKYGKITIKFIIEKIKFTLSFFGKANMHVATQYYLTIDAPEDNPAEKARVKETMQNIINKVDAADVNKYITTILPTLEKDHLLRVSLHSFKKYNKSIVENIKTKDMFKMIYKTNDEQRHALAMLYMMTKDFKCNDLMLEELKTMLRKRLDAIECLDEHCYNRYREKIFLKRLAARIFEHEFVIGNDDCGRYLLPHIIYLKEIFDKRSKFFEELYEYKIIKSKIDDENMYEYVKLQEIEQYFNKIFNYLDSLPFWNFTFHDPDATMEYQLDETTKEVDNMNQKNLNHESLKQSFENDPYVKNLKQLHEKIKECEKPSPPSSNSSTNTYGIMHPAWLPIN